MTKIRRLAALAYEFRGFGYLLLLVITISGGISALAATSTKYNGEASCPVRQINTTITAEGRETVVYAKCDEIVSKWQVVERFKGDGPLPAIGAIYMCGAEFIKSSWKDTPTILEIKGACHTAS